MIVGKSLLNMQTGVGLIVKQLFSVFTGSYAEFPFEIATKIIGIVKSGHF